MADTLESLLRDAVYDDWNADSDLTSAAVGGLHYERDPDKVKHPYTRFEFGESVKAAAFAKDAASTVEVDIWFHTFSLGTSTGGSSQEGEDVRAKIEAVFGSRHQFTIAGHKKLRIRDVGGRSTSWERQTSCWHGINHYRGIANPIGN